MTTSSDHRTPAPQPSGEHWYELTATLPQKSTEAFGKWLDQELDSLEQELEDLLDSTEDGDAWVSLEVPADFCLNPDHDRGDAWAALRNVVQQLSV